jgi:hypothetical protein
LDCVAIVGEAAKIPGWCDIVSNTWRSRGLLKLLDLQFDVVHQSLHVRAPSGELGHRLLKRGDTGVVADLDLHSADGFQIHDALSVVGVAVDVVRFQGPTTTARWWR